MTETSYIREYDAIITKYEGIEAEINERYDDLRDEIEAKTITLLYTQADKDAELEANEAARQAELSSMEDDKAAEISQFQTDYKTNMDRAQYLKTVPIDYDYLDEKIENLDFTVSQTGYEEDILEEMKDVMAALPYTVNNTKYMYLTLNDKCDALKNLADEEYAAYEEDYDEITERYAALRATIEAKQITENYTQADKDAELQANEAAKNAEIAPINADYLGKSGAIAVALTNLKTDKETGFIGDVHINGKLHVDTNLNIEGNLNNIPIGNYITSNDLTQITTDISNLQTGKANTNHNHDTAYAAINHNHDTAYATINHNHDTAYATINHNHDTEYATINHTHTTFNNSLSISSSQASGELRTLESYNPSMSENTKSMICFGKSYSPRQCGFIGFVYNSSNPYVEIGMHSLGNASLKVYNNSTTSAGTITAPAININNTSGSSLWMNLLSVLNGNLANGHNLSIYFGKSFSNYNCGQLTFTPNGENSNVHIDIFGFGNLLNIYKNKVESSNPIIGSNVLANNETRLAAAETAITTKANATHTHTLSDITDYTAPTAYDDTQIRTLINGKADTNHNHDNDYAAINHNHTISEITNLSTTISDINVSISNKADSSMLTALTARVAIVETGKADINHNHNNDYAAINHNHDSDYVKKTDLITHQATSNYTETLTKTTQEQTTEYLTGFLSSVSITESNTTITIQCQHSWDRGLRMEFIIVCGEETFTQPYNYDIVSDSFSDSFTNYTISGNYEVDELYYEPPQHTITFTIHSTNNSASDNFQIYYNCYENFNLDVPDWHLAFSVEVGYTYTKEIIYEDVVNTVSLIGLTILKTIYPIGSIYTSMTNTNPATLFGFGTWTQITDRFLYCADNSGATGGSETHTHTTGNHTLTIDEMPSHSHSITHYDNDSSVSVGHYQQTWWTANWKSVSTGSAGGNQPHNHGDTGSASNMPPYITVYAWYRTA